MQIDETKCVGCGRCLWYCTVQDGIKLKKRRTPPYRIVATIIRDNCLECGNCLRMANCKKEAIYEEEDVYERPRSIRKFFSDPKATHVETNIPGRGTEESKTNDVTNRIKEGEVSVALEFGRPGIGAGFGDIQLMSTAMEELGVHFEEKNPFTSLMINKKGDFHPDTEKEKILSGIMEMQIPISKLPQVLRRIKEISPLMESVFSLDIFCPFQKDGSIPIRELAAKEGFSVRPNAKINVGLGRASKEKGSTS